MNNELEWAEIGGVKIILKVIAKDDVTLNRRIERKWRKGNRG